MTSRHPSISCNSSPNCVCPTCDLARVKAGSSCSSTGCAVTSQNQGFPSAGVANRTIRGGRVRYSAPAEQRQTQLSTYAIPVLQIGEPSGRVTEFYGGMNDLAPPQAETPVSLVHAAGAVNVVPASGAVNVVPASGAVNVVRAAGQVGTTPPAPVPVPSAPPSSPTQVQQLPAKPGDQQPQQQGGIAIDAQTATALAGLGGTLLQGTRDIVVAAITQGAESERERGRQQASVQIAQMQRQGLLTQQQAADALANVERALAPLAPPQTPVTTPAPQGFFESMTTGQKVAIGVGGAALLAALGYGVYRATRD